MALIPPFFLDAIVAIGVGNEDDVSWVGTGFLLGRHIEKDESGKDQYYTFLITNKHVIVDEVQIWLRFNPEGSELGRKFSIDLNDGNTIVTGHPDDELDVAVIPISVAPLREGNYQFYFFESDKHVLDISAMKDAGVSEGDFIYTPGFPMGIAGEERQYVIVRSGSIARIRDLFEGYGKKFLIDAFAFPGNSGSPVLLKPELVSIDGTRSCAKSALIGIIESYIPYHDIAVSRQTGRTRIIFEDNSGLANVIPTDYIMETVEKCINERIKPISSSNSAEPK